MKIGFFELEGWEEPILNEVLMGHELFFFNEHIDEEHIPERTDFDSISVFTGSKLTAQVLEKFPNLKLITARSTGFDHIDIAAAAARGVQVGYVPGYGDNTVAEFAFGLMLALTRNIFPAIHRVKEDNSFNLDGLRGIDLMGRTLGVIGTGRIGKHAVQIAKGFGMKVVAYDSFPDNAFAEATGIKYMALPDLLSASDIVTIHCPATKETFHLINKETIQFMKQGSYLVNTARGTIVETEALVQALQSGRLRGAALDVLEEEGDIKDELSFIYGKHPREEELRTILLDHVLLKMPNVIITPHTAFNSEEAVRRILNTTLENIQGFVAGNMPHPVPLPQSPSVSVPQ
ncbi:MAG: NAD(P)-dependent oxidoreductase [Candidatus Liptonbacteria bacterium]